jgi:hypothetical protein
MADEEISPLMRQHLKKLVDYDPEQHVPARPLPPPQPPRLRKPMGGPIRGTVFVDGQAVGPTPASWAEPKSPPLKVYQSTPLTEEEEIEERKTRKKNELEDRKRRWGWAEAE